MYAVCILASYLIFLPRTVPNTLFFFFRSLQLQCCWGGLHIFRGLRNWIARRVLGLHLTSGNVSLQMFICFFFPALAFKWRMLINIPGRLPGYLCKRSEIDYHTVCMPHTLTAASYTAGIDISYYVHLHIQYFHKHGIVSISKYMYVNKCMQQKHTCSLPCMSETCVLWKEDFFC